MRKIGKWICSVILGVIGIIALVLSGRGSGGKTSQETKDRLEDLTQTIEEKKKKLKEVETAHDSQYEEDVKDIYNSVPRVDNPVEYANDLWNSRGKRDSGEGVL